MDADARRTIILVLLACFVALNAIAYMIRATRRSDEGWGRQEPKIPLYPGAKQPKYLKNDVLGWQSLVFQVEENHPSTKVFDYYCNLLESKGYRMIEGSKAPSWQQTEVSKDGQKLEISGFWQDPEQLRVFQLDVIATEEFDRDLASGRLIGSSILPGEKVEIILSRKVFIGQEETTKGSK